MGRNYKDEYEKFQKDKTSYRAKLNKYNRDKGTYGNRDGLDASHEEGGIIGFEPSSKNKGKKEKSRLKGSKRKKFKNGGYNMKTYGGGELEGPSHEEGGIPVEAEGGEIIVNTSKNGAADMHTEDLLALNDSPEDYEIVHKDELASDGGMIEKNNINRSAVDILEYINKHGDIPMSDARNRRNK